MNRSFSDRYITVGDLSATVALFAKLSTQLPYIGYCNILVKIESNVHTAVKQLELFLPNNWLHRRIEHNLVSTSCILLRAIPNSISTTYNTPPTGLAGITTLQGELELLMFLETLNNFSLYHRHTLSILLTDHHRYLFFGGGFFQINARTELALRYNDISPLENHHCAVAFEILEKVQARLSTSVFEQDNQ